MEGVVLGFLVLIVLICLKLNIIVAAPAAIMVIALVNQINPLPLLTEIYVSGMGGFLQDFLFIFILSSILGTVIKYSGRAEVLGKSVTGLFGSNFAATGIFFTTALLSYGGISGFVLVFTVYPIAIEVFNKTNLPRSLIISCITGGNILIGMVMPGSPQVQNLILMDFFETPATAGVLPGLVGILCGVTFATSYLQYKTRRYQVNEENYSPDISLKEKLDTAVAIIPLAVVLFSLIVLELMPEICLALGVLTAVLIDFKKFNLFSTINEGVSNAVLPLLFAASAMGFGQVLSQVEAFDLFISQITTMDINPYIITGILGNIGAGLMGSSSNGLLLILGTVGEELKNLGDPHLLHRVLFIASTGLDTLPQNGVYLAMLAYTGLTIRETFMDYTFVTIIAPIISLIGAITAVILLAG